MGKFSSDRTIAEYARDIWNVQTLAVEADIERCLHEGACLVDEKTVQRSTF
jgi:starch phosphorylase